LAHKIYYGPISFVLLKFKMAAVAAMEMDKQLYLDQFTANFVCSYALRM